MRRIRASLAGRWRLLASYVLFAASGSLALIGTSPVLLKQGGQTIAIAWGVFCLIGAVLGVYGFIRRMLVLELVGDMLGASATLTWAVALIMQAYQQGSVNSLTAACLAGALVTRIGQRLSDVRRTDRADRRNGKE